MGLNICVFCGSSPGENPKHMALAGKLGQLMAEQKHRLIYGGGGLGLMGAVARAAHEAGGEVLGVMPDFLSEIEKTLTEVEHVFVPDMHARKIRMYEEADGFIVLPGGIGTLEEVIEILSWLRLNLHQKPVVFLSDIGYWDKLGSLFNDMIAEGFVPDAFTADVQMSETAKDAIDALRLRIENPVPRKDLRLSVEEHS